MKDGDFVRFRDVLNHRTQELSEWKYGVLIEYKSWEKIATVLHNGEVIRMRAEYVTKAGRKDIERYRRSKNG
tara:strand:- start:1499 stop:1714 length:216 start_codon:yes stop_codon:yes gene_type:complete